MTDKTSSDFSPVTPDKLQSGKKFAANYAGEHVAGTEFVIGALFVSWGVSTYDILIGLLIGNFLAVLSWGLITAPIATDTRLTLYAYLEKIAGRGTIKLYSIVNCILFSILAGAMITVSASAIRIPFGIPAQVDWYPTSFAFVLVALVVGATVVFVAVKGFRGVARFAEICAPWMILMFIIGALSILPVLVVATQGIETITSFSDFMLVANEHIWVYRESEVGFWHVAAFAWICNLSMHGAMGDMTLLRYARKASYGYFSAFGMFIGHYVAWICAGIMGAGAAMLLETNITQLDAGGVAFQSLGIAGIIAVVIAGWTTSNPTIYRAGLAFQSLYPNLSREKATMIVGAVTTIIACFPFVFTKLIDFVGFMGILLAPIGAIIITEHWLFTKLGLTRYWSKYKGNSTNYPALFTWIVSMVLALYLERTGTIHLFFLLIPIWIFATLMYLLLARQFGANEKYNQAIDYEEIELNRKLNESKYLIDNGHLSLKNKKFKQIKPSSKLFQIVSYLSLSICSVLAIFAYKGSDIDQFKSMLFFFTVIYFVSAIIWTREKQKYIYKYGGEEI
tara:strand:+ start:3260 stop:4951 length:1692 start_codon:yes stop_codon:yes gene_type:complete